MASLLGTRHEARLARQIATSFRTFGITDGTTSLLIIKLSTNPSITSSSVSEHLSAAVKGTAIDHPLENIAKMSDLKALRKMYKINGTDSKKKGGAVRDGDEDTERQELEVLAIGMMALRGQT
ncbi:MAG: hypothetical protein Q9191_004316 [Dirinaria sp. TL-2023a]